MCIVCYYETTLLFQPSSIHFDTFSLQAIVKHLANHGVKQLTVFCKNGLVCLKASESIPKMETRYLTEQDVALKFSQLNQDHQKCSNLNRHNIHSSLDDWVYPECVLRLSPDLVILVRILSNLQNRGLPIHEIIRVCRICAVDMFINFLPILFFGGFNTVQSLEGVPPTAIAFSEIL